MYACTSRRWLIRAVLEIVGGVHALLQEMSANVKQPCIAASKSTHASPHHPLRRVTKHDRIFIQWEYLTRFVSLIANLCVSWLPFNMYHASARQYRGPPNGYGRHFFTAQDRFVCLFLLCSFFFLWIPFRLTCCDKHRNHGVGYGRMTTMGMNGFNQDGEYGIGMPGRSPLDGWVLESWLFWFWW